MCASALFFIYVYIQVYMFAGVCMQICVYTGVYCAGMCVQGCACICMCVYRCVNRDCAFVSQNTEGNPTSQVCVTRYICHIAVRGQLSAVPPLPKGS